MKKDEYHDRLWAVVTIVVHPNLKSRDNNGRFEVNHYNKHVLKKWDFPKWIIDKHQWYFNWVLHLYSARFKMYSVDKIYCGYFYETKEKLNSKRQQKISQAQGQVTKYQNKINALKQYCSGTLFNDYTKHPVFPQLNSKLIENRKKLEDAIMESVNESV